MYRHYLIPLSSSQWTKSLPIWLSNYYRKLSPSSFPISPCFHRSLINSAQPQRRHPLCSRSICGGENNILARSTQNRWQFYQHSGDARRRRRRRQARPLHQSGSFQAHESRRLLRGDGQMSSTRKRYGDGRLSFHCSAFVA